MRTPRLWLEPVTAELVLAAAQGRMALETKLGARVHPEWRGGHVFTHGRSPTIVDDKPRYALVVHASDRVLIGEVRFDPLRDGDGFEIGYAIVSPYRRQGYAVEATERILEALADEGVTRLVAGCSMRNLASVRTLRRLGFELDGSTVRGSAFWWTRELD